MHKIYSKVDPTVLLHIISRKDNIKENRVDISPKNEYLQVACKKANKSDIFKAHRHIDNNRSIEITQESWVIINGSAKVFYYDIDEELIHTDVLNSGDISITFHGGHAMEITEDGTLLYEFKNGPYLGQAKDKVWMENK